jgi:uncharacterized protein (DUF2164 family)
MPITLPEESKQVLLQSIKQYFLEERDEDIGDLQAGFFLEFILKEVGPSIYNQAVKDAQAALQTAVADLDLTLHEPEFGYSAEQGLPGRPGR